VAVACEGAEELDRGRGGARNLTMLRMLRECLAPATVRAADTLGWASDAIEAQALWIPGRRGLKACR
jgi:anhydro-N-acetylmuramic acid kinase